MLAAGALGVAGYAVLRSLDPPTAAVATATDVLGITLYGLAAAICVMRWRHTRGAEPEWAWLAGAFGLWGCGFAVYYGFVEGDPSPPAPSAADAFWLAYYPLVLVAIFHIARQRFRHARRIVLIDGAVLALALAGLASQFVLAPLAERASGDRLAIMTALSYPVLDIALLMALVVMISLSRWRLDRMSLVLSAGLTVNVACNWVYALKVADGTYDPDTILDAGWPLALMLMAAASWQRRAPVRPGAPNAGSLVAAPLAALVAEVVLLAYINVESASGVSLTLGLVLVGIAAAALALALTLRETQRLRGLAHEDSLTGLLNHRGFQSALDSLIESSRAEKQRFSVLIADLDDFKAINDSEGHDAGDRVLTRVAKCITRSIRPQDESARVGGDEFAILLPGAGADEARIVARRVRDQVPRSAGIGLSVGVATFPEDGENKERLLKRADTGLYAAKPHRQRPSHAEAVALLAQDARDGLRDPRVLGRRAVALAREQLGMDLAYLARFLGSDEVFDAVDGDPPRFRFDRGERLALEETYCGLLASGELDGLVRDASADSRVCELAVTAEANIGAWIGVPVRLSDGSWYGTLCTFSHRPRPELGTDDVAFLELLARLVADAIEIAQLRASDGAGFRALDAEDVQRRAGAVTHQRVR